MSDDSGSGLSRRQMIAAGTTGLIAATAAVPARADGRGTARGRQDAPDGTPQQIHLTWGNDPTRTVVVSWASPGRAEHPRVRIGQRVIDAAERGYSDGANGAVTWTYHARVDGLRPGATYGYAVTADNDANAADPFSATFTTAPAGRAAFRFTSFGDLPLAGSTAVGGTGPSGGAPSQPMQAAYAVGAVETFQPLFHLLNGDLADSVGSSSTGSEAAHGWRDFGNNVQASAANRPWLPVPGDDQLAAGHAEPGLASYLTRYTLPSNGIDGHEGRWYAFRVGTALFVCLSGDDVAAAAPARGYSGGAQTRWLESTLAAARADASIDWIVVQVHQCACSSTPDGEGSDLGIRREWLPLFDTYEVDLVLSGHADGYERSFPVRGRDPAAGTDGLSGATTDTCRPHPVTTVDSGVFDTSQGTVHLVLGSGGSAKARGSETSGSETSGSETSGSETSDSEASDPASPARTARVVSRPAVPVPVPDQRVPGDGPRPADVVEPATWSARRDTSAGYGIAVFDVNPGNEAGGQTSVTVRYYHAARPDLADASQVGGGAAGQAAGTHGGPAGDYALFETFTLVRPRSDGRRWHPKG